MGLRRRDFKIKKQEYTLSWQINDRRRRRYDSRGPYRLSQSRLLAHHECKAPPGVGEVGHSHFRVLPGLGLFRSDSPVPQKRKARRALPFAAGFSLVAYLRYYRGDRNCFIESMLEARPRSPL